MNIDAVGNRASELRHSKALEALTRIGFISKGVVYMLIGVLALMAAFRWGGETTDQQGVIARIAQQPFGEFALIVIGVGLLAYAAWRFTSAVLDNDNRGSGGKGIAHRAGQFFSGAAYTGIAYTALRVVAGSSESSGGGEATRTWTARLMDAPGGTLLVMLVGVAILIAAFMQARRGLKERFRRDLRTQEMSAEEQRWTMRAGKWGYVARGVVFGITGLFVLIAGLRSNPQEARGLEGALDTLARQPFGQWLLALVAAGLICYGVYALIESRYRRVHF